MFIAEVYIFLTIIFISVLGFLILCNFSFFDEKSLLETIPYSFGIGIGMISFILFIYSLTGLPFKHNVIVLLFLIIFVFLLLLIWNRKNKIEFFFKFSFSPLFSFFLFLTILLSLFVVFESLLRPLYAWDGWATWLMMSKVFFIEKKIGHDMYVYLSTDYPYVISLFISFLYISIGFIHDRAVLLLFSSFYIALLIVFYFSIKKYGSSKIAIVFTFLLASLQNLIRHGGRFEAGHVDLPLAFYIFLSLQLLFSYLETKKIKMCILLNIFLSIAALVKNEGLLFAAIINLILTINIIKKKQWNHIFGFIPFMFLYGSWYVFKLMFSVPKNYLFNNPSIDFSRTFSVGKKLLEEFINIQNWNLLWIIFFVGLLYYLFSKKSTMLTTIIIIMICQIIGYFLIFMISPVIPEVHANIFDRLLIHLAPIALFFIGILFNREVKKNEVNLSSSIPGRNIL